MVRAVVSVRVTSTADRAEANDTKNVPFGTGWRLKSISFSVSGSVDTKGELYAQASVKTDAITGRLASIEDYLWRGHDPSKSFDMPVGTEDLCELRVWGISANTVHADFSFER